MEGGEEGINFLGNEINARKLGSLFGGFVELCWALSSFVELYRALFWSDIFFFGGFYFPEKNLKEHEGWKKSSIVGEINE